MDASVSWLRVEERLTASLLLFIRNINALKIPNSLHSQLTHSSDTHTYPTRHATRGLSHSPNPEQIQENTQYYIEPLLHGTQFHLILLKVTANLL
jgi:hypothetical protein